VSGPGDVSVGEAGAGPGAALWAGLREVERASLTECGGRVCVGVCVGMGVCARVSVMWGVAVCVCARVCIESCVCGYAGVRGWGWVAV
jgi:hypothetical protein